MKKAFLFPGQGAQFPGMLRELYDANKKCRQILDVADSVLGRGISELIINGTQDDLNLTRNTQPCILAADLIAFYAVEKNYRPDAVAGFSLGEYAALTAAGVFSLEDVFSLVQARADAMQKAAPAGSGAMAAVMKVDAQVVYRLCETAEGYVVPVNYNCPGQIVVSGETSAVDSFIALAHEQKIRCVKLPVSAPCHCKIMEPAAAVIKSVLDSTVLHKPEIPIYLNVDGKSTDNIDSIKVKLVQQVKMPVLWEQTLRSMQNDGCNVFVECGPGETLSGFVKRTLPDSTRIGISDAESLKTALNILRG